MILQVVVGLLTFCLWKDISTEGSECLPNLKNSAVYVGYENTIMNLTADPNNVKWTLIPTSDEFGSYLISDYDGYRDPSLTGLFSLNQSGLVILNATTAPTNEGPISTAGVYIAQCQNNDNRTGAKLLVVREHPRCSCNASSPDAVQLSCSIIYADGSLHPMDANMTWKIGDVVYTTDTPTRTRIDYYVYESTSTITVDNSVPATFTCTVAFNEPTDYVYSFVTTNAPEFIASCSVAVCYNAETTLATTITTVPTTTTSLPTTTVPTTTTLEPTTTVPTTTTSPTTTVVPTTTTSPPPTVPDITTTSTTTTVPTTTVPTTTVPTTTVPTTNCNCAQTTECPSQEQNCSQSTECQTGETNWIDIYDECVVQSELYVKYDNCCPQNLICGVVVTLRNDSRWLIHDPLCDDTKCDTVVVDAACMSSEWKLLAEKKIIISGVGDYMQAGYIASTESQNMTDCSDSCRRMFNLP